MTGRSGPGYGKGNWACAICGRKAPSTLCYPCRSFVNKFKQLYPNERLQASALLFLGSHQSDRNAS